MHCIPNLNVDTVLGVDFIELNEAVINFKDYTLTLDQSIIEMENITESIVEKETLNKIVTNYSFNKFVLDPKKKFLNRQIGVINGVEYEIKLINDQPIHDQTYTPPLAPRKDVEHHINELLQLKIIRYSKSKYCANPFIIKRKNKIRMVVNYKNLNKITNTEYFPFPNIHEQFLKLKENTIFSKIDLTKGYQQIKIREEDIHKTAFSIMGMKYEYNTLLFGLKNAPFYFQQVMFNILGHLPYVKIYIEDILIFSKNKEDQKNRFPDI